MEKWKIATIAALLVALLGFGIAQQNRDKQNANSPQTSGTAPAAPNLAANYLGKTPPAWNFKIWNGAPVSLGSLKGKPALVEIFRVNCSHCQEAAPFLSALQKRYAPRGFKMVSIQSPADPKDAQNSENKWKDVQAWLKTNGVTSPVAFDAGSQYFQGTLKNKFFGGDGSKLSYPTLWILDSSGKIAFAETGHDTGKAIALAVEIEKLFPTSSSAAQNGADLTKWLTAHLLELQADKIMAKALADDIAQRLEN